MEETKLKYNQVCPGHSHYCWSYRHLMREGDIFCTKDYKRLPKELKNRSYKILQGVDVASNKSIIISWLLENEQEYKCGCRKDETA